MNKLLTLGIPTYNRAQLLDKQLAWLAQAIKGFESACEILISDNCSTDNTPEVIKKWQPFLSNATLKLNRNSENIGAVRNIAYCINTATSKYVWTISDDDRIHEQTLAYVIQTLTTHSNLALLLLNYSKRSVITGKIKFERCFAIDDDTVSANGKAVFERCLEERGGVGVALTTALVYRTDLAQCAVQEWSSGLSNLLVQLYWTGFCAIHGSVKVTKDNYLECAAGNQHFLQDEKVTLSFYYADLPEVFVKLMQLGYSRHLCHQLVLKRLTEFNWKFIFRMLKRAPVTTLHVLSRYLGSLGYAHYEIFKPALAQVLQQKEGKQGLLQRIGLRS